jgi:murein L,D-transpeptidase YcbB/YkuD
MLAAFLVCLLVAGSSPQAQSPSPQEADRSRRETILETAHHPWLKWPAFPDRSNDMRALYAAEPDGLVWFEGEVVHPATALAVEALVDAGERGLSPEDYGAPLLAARLQGLRLGEGLPEGRTLFDLGLSLGLLRHLRDVHQGRVDPRSVGFHSYGHTDDLDLPALLRRGRDEVQIAETLDRLEPAYPPYQRLKTALATWRALAHGPPLEVAPEMKKLEPGDAYEGTRQLGARLRAFGDLSADAPVPGVHYEGLLVLGVKALQARHGLTPDGTLGRETFRALNGSVSGRVRQLELALERLRWLPDFAGQDVVVVDIPAFLLWAFEAGKGLVLTMRVVVGKAVGHETPVFLGEMERVTFRPYWNVPPSIARKELLPKLRGDAGYLAREDMEVVATGGSGGTTFPLTLENLALLEKGRLRMRQRPGPRNALGRVVFSFPNADNIYMHDTPARELFARSRRDFSHGCIRIEDPLGLARWVLRDQPAWTEERIENALDLARPTGVSLTRPVPVLIFYATAYVDREGRARFFEDIYGHDARLQEALERGYPYAR